MPTGPVSIDGDLEGYRRLLLGYFRNHDISDDTRQDLTQEALLTAHLQVDSFQGTGSMEAWLIGIARNLLLNHFRHETTRRTHLSESIRAEKRPHQAIGSRWARAVDTDTRTPETNFLDSEREAALLEAVDALPTAMRCCIEGRLDGLRYREIADATGYPIENVRDQLYRARQRLQGQLDKVFEAVAIPHDTTEQDSTRQHTSGRSRRRP